MSLAPAPSPRLALVARQLLLLFAVLGEGCAHFACARRSVAQLSLKKLNGFGSFSHRPLSIICVIKRAAAASARLLNRFSGAAANELARAVEDPIPSAWLAQVASSGRIGVTA